MPVTDRHAVLGTPCSALRGTLRAGAVWYGVLLGVERLFWQIPGVVTTAVGYAAGQTPNPTYKEVCSGQTGHNEVVRVIYDPAEVSYETLLGAFWENHDPTQGMRQGNDIGTQYRSGIYCYGDTQETAARAALRPISRL